MGDRLQHVKEVFGPYAAGIIAAALAFQYAHVNPNASASAPLFDRIYSGSLSVASVFASFALGYYTIILSRATPFLDRMSKNRAYGMLLNQTKEAVLSVVALVCVTGVFYFAQIVPGTADGESRFLFSLWVFCVVVAVCCWVRVSINTIKVLSLH